MLFKALAFKIVIKGYYNGTQASFEEALKIFVLPAITRSNARAYIVPMALALQCKLSDSNKVDLD